MPSLKPLLAGSETLVLPGVFDGISARFAAEAGFPALYMTGYGTVASMLGMPDAGMASYGEMLDALRRIRAAAPLPLIADGDTGYGGLLNVDRTVRGYEAAGAAGIQLEDQEYPKKCGHTPGRRVIETADAVRKLRVAVAARDSAEFLIVARTDARTGQGLDAAMRRGEQFLAAGADILFIESPESIEELARIGETFKGACLLANMVEGGRTPFCSAAELAKLGFRIGLYPASGFLAAAGALASVYRHLRETGSSSGAATPMLPFATMNRVMGFPGVDAFDRKWAETAPT